MRVLFVVRFRKNGKVGSFKTYANKSGEAAKKCRGGKIISVRKATSHAR